ncbi:MAG: two-component system response regulator RppA [Cyanobacteriota bacterium]|jgi:DNA-binding response OmpR family regulator
MRILLVEDEPDLGQALTKTLSRERYIVDWVQDGKSAWGYLDQRWVNYTLAIFDWMLPGLSGLELCQKLRAGGSPLPVLILTARDQIADRVEGLDAGADDYLIKPFGMAELFARLRSLQRRSPQLLPQRLTVGDWLLDYGASTVSPPRHPPLLLTAKEFQLLEYFLKHPQQILSGEQIRAQLWPLASESSSNVVAAQVRLLRRKLGEAGQDGAIETVYGLGYRFAG